MIRGIVSLIIKILMKGDFVMMAMFFAQRVILGKTAFEDVPPALKPGTAELLLESGLPGLVPGEYGGTADAEGTSVA